MEMTCRGLRRGLRGASRRLPLRRRPGSRTISSGAEPASSPTVCSLSSLLGHLSLERLEQDLFRGASIDPGWGRVFGGQVLAQALSAAQATTEPGRSAHSLHSYFLRPGDVSRPIIYDVERIRDGASFSARHWCVFQHPSIAIIGRQSPYLLSLVVRPWHIP